VILIELYISPLATYATDDAISDGSCVPSINHCVLFDLFWTTSNSMMACLIEQKDLEKSRKIRSSS